MSIRTVSRWLAWLVFVGTSAASPNQQNTATPEPVPQRIVGLRYPRLAHLAAIQGKVELEAVVSAEGSVTDVKVVSGHPLLVDFAKNSLRRWRFTGCSASNASCVARVTFVFVLEEGECGIDECPSDIQIDLPSTITVKSEYARAIVD